MNDFYFVYYPVGPQFIKTMISSFRYVPDDVNIIVMTPTPELLKDVEVKFNLIVLNSNDLIDDFSREYEPIIIDTDDDLYTEKLISNFNNGIRFSSSTQRYIMPWLIQRGITKFALLDADCLINFNEEVHSVYDKIKQSHENNNMLFGPIMPCGIHDIQTISYVREIFESEGLDWEIVKSMKFPVITFDGWLRGFWFKDTDLLQKYFNLWDNTIKASHKLKSPTLSGNNWTVPDEWITAMIGVCFSKMYDVKLEDHRLVKHIYHPENDFFFLHHDYLYKHMYELVTTKSREEFFEKNKEAIIKFYSNQNGISENRIHEVVYDYNKYN